MSKIIDKSLFHTLDFLPEGYFIINDEYKVIYWNKVLEALTGIKENQILNKKLEDFFSNFGQEIYKRRINPVFHGGAPVIFSAKLHKSLFSRDNIQKDFYYQVTISALRITEDKYNALFSIENRSEVYSQINELINLRDEALDEASEKEKINSILLKQRNEIQEAFTSLSEKNLKIEKQKKQLQELNATKDRFFSILAHDLINPFSALDGLTSLLLKKFDSYSPNEIKDMIKIMSHTTTQTYDLLRKLLQWSQTQSGRIENKPSKINLLNTITNNFELLENSFIKKQINFTNTVNKDLFVYVDNNMINTVLRNLMSNAIKFTPLAGNINISTKLLNKPQKTVVQVSVIDSGIGISSDVINKLFKIEENISTIGTNNEKGTGLGLILCKEFVKKMGGEIWVESEKGKGSKFIFTIPAYNN